MTKPPASGPSSDIDGVHQDAVNHRKPDPLKGTAKDIEQSDKEAKGRPEHSSQRS
jgi:hypothetical protein